MGSSISKGTLCALTVGLLACSTAGAQDAATTEVSQPATEQTAPAASAATSPAEADSASAVSESAAADNADIIPEVIVTAQRVEERAQDVPISMTIFSQDQLTSRNVSSGTDLATYTPSLATNSEFGTDNTSFAIRGFRQEINTTASVAVYFADVVAPRGGSSINTGDGAGPGSFFDLQNVQVLKGPQGTLFGRNTDGGAILLVPQKPTSDYGGYLESGIGNYGMKRIQGVVNIPVSDSFRMRFGVDSQNRDGYLNNISGIGPSNFGDIGYTAVRASAVWDITENIENYTIASYVNSSHNGSATKLIACDPAVGLSHLVGCDQFTTDSAHGFRSVENDIPNAKSEMEQWQVINTTTWAQSDNLIVKNIVSYAQLSNTIYNDLFGTNYKTPSAFGPYGNIPLHFQTVYTAPGHKLNNESTTTEEFRLQGNLFDDRLVWQSGIYGEFNRPIASAGVTSATTINCTDISQLECYDVVGALSGAEGYAGTVNYTVGKLSYTDYGIYQQASYSLTENLKLTEGLRYTSDTSKSNYDSAVYFFPSANTPELYCVDTTSPYNRFTGTGAQAPSSGDCPVDLKQKSHAPTWLLGLDYKLTPDALLYGKYSRGYRQGSVSPSSAQGFRTYDPEKVDTFELGAKTSFDKFVRGTFNVAAFYNDFTDQQLSVGFLCPDTNPSCGAASALGIVNAGKSRIWGLEVESILAPFKGFTLSTSYAYINSKLISIDPPGLPAGSPYAPPTSTVGEGSAIPLTPKHKVSTVATYTLPLSASLGKVSASLGYNYQSSEIQTGKTASPYYKTPGYSLVNMNLDWKAIGGSNVDLGLFATNLLNKEYLNYVVGIYNGAGQEYAQIGEPRMYGMRVRMGFGE